MTEQLTIEGIEVAEPEQYHPILEVWLAVLTPARKMKSEQISMQWCLKIIGSYPGITYADMPKFTEAYFDLIDEFILALESSIELEPECMNVMSAQEDAEVNRSLYLSIITTWQLIVLERELSWLPSDPNAAIQVAALAEANKIIFDKNGILNFLDQINFEMGESDQEMLRQAAEDYKAGRGK